MGAIPKFLQLVTTLYGNRMGFNYQGDLVANGKLMQASLGLDTAATEAAATFNTTAIQAALTAGGLVQITTPGTYYYNAAMVIPSNTKVVHAPGVTLKAFANSNCQCYVNSAFVATPASVTLTWTSGMSFSVQWASHGLAVNDFVFIDQTSITDIEQSKFKGVFRVSSVTDVNNFVVFAFRLPSTAPTTGFKARKANVNIHIEGGIFDGNTAGNPGWTNLQGSCIVFSGVANCGIKQPTFVDYPYHGLTVSADYAGVYEEFFANISSAYGGDMVKLYGPACGTVIRKCSGRTFDDIVSVQSKDSAAYVQYQPSYGDIIGVKVQDTTINTDTSRGVGGVVLYSSPNEYTGGVEIDGVHGTCDQRAVGIQAGDNLAGVIFSVTVRRVTANSYPAISIGGGGGTATVSCDRLTIEECDQNPQNATADFFQVTSNFTGNIVTIRKSGQAVNSIASPYWPNGGGGLWANLNGTVNVLNIEDCSFNGNTSNAIMGRTANGASYRNINIRNTFMSGLVGIQVQATPGVTPNISVTDCDITCSLGAVKGDASCNVYAAGNTLNSTSSLVNRTAGTVNLTDGGQKAFNGSSTLTSGAVTLKRAVPVAQTVASSATPALDCNLGNAVSLATGANATVTWGAPTNVPPAGERVTITITQDATGARTVAFNAAYIFPTAFSNTGNTANKKTTVLFVSDGTSLVAQGANSWY